MKYAFFAIAFSLLFTMLGYVLIRGWQALPTSNRMLYAQIFGALLALLMIGLFFENLMPPILSKAVTFAGYTFLIIAVYLAIAFLLVDIIRFANYLLHFAPAGMHGLRLWAMTGSLAIITVALVVGNYKFNHPEIVKLDLTVDKPLKNKEIKIVAASDIHLGNSIDIKRLQKYVKLIRLCFSFQSLPDRFRDLQADGFRVRLLPYQELRCSG